MSEDMKTYEIYNYTPHTGHLPNFKSRLAGHIHQALQESQLEHLTILHVWVFHPTRTLLIHLDTEANDLPPAVNKDIELENMHGELVKEDYLFCFTHMDVYDPYKTTTLHEEKNRKLH